MASDLDELMDRGAYKKPQQPFLELHFFVRKPDENAIA